MKISPAILLGIFTLSFLANAFVNLRAMLNTPLHFTGFDIYVHVFYTNEILLTNRLNDLYIYSKGLAIIIAALAQVTELPVPLLYNLVGLIIPSLFSVLLYIVLARATNNSLFAICVTYLVSLVKGSGGTLGLIWPYPSSVAFLLILFSIFPMAYHTTRNLTYRQLICYILGVSSILMTHRYSVVILTIAYSAFVLIRILRSSVENRRRLISKYIALGMLIIPLFGVPTLLYLYNRAIAFNTSFWELTVEFLRDQFLLNLPVQSIDIIYNILDVLSPVNLILFGIAAITLRKSSRFRLYCIPFILFLPILLNPFLWSIFHRLIYPATIALTIPIGALIYTLLKKARPGNLEFSQNLGIFFILLLFVMLPFNTSRYLFTGENIRRVSISEEASFQWIVDYSDSSIRVLADPGSSFFLVFLHQRTAFPLLASDNVLKARIHAAYQGEPAALVNEAHTLNVTLIFFSRRTGRWLLNPPETQVPYPPTVDEPYLNLALNLPGTARVYSSNDPVLYLTLK
jgi:hypothetical protein